MAKYFVNQRTTDNKIFIAKSKVMSKECVCIGSILAIPADKEMTGGLRVGNVGTDIKGNRIEITAISPFIGSEFQ